MIKVQKIVLQDRFRKSLVLCLLALIHNASFSQQKHTISGSLKDGTTGEDLIGARVTIKELPGVGSVTNTYGFYSLTLPEGKYTLQFKSLGFALTERPVDLTADVIVNLELAPDRKLLTEVLVTAEKEDENVTSTEMGVEKLNVKDVEAIPVFFGEKDILKTMQLLPGVKSAGEGNSGFFVRGGAADQNLILLDGAPVYNASHLLGFFSVFNSDALKDVKLYKGTAPPKFGGRLSSTMEVHMKEGNQKKLAVSGGVGLISSRLTIEGPIVKDRGSFIISGRRTYADLFLKLSKNEALQNSTLYFYDFNAKANYRLGDKDRVFLSGYFGRDNLGFSDQFGFDWGNTTGTLRWNHIYSDKLFGNTSLVFSNYNYKINFGSNGQTFQIGSQIQDWNFQEDFDFFANSNNTLNFGFNIIHHTFKPGEIETGEGIDFILNDIENRFSVESAAYLSNEQKIGKRFTMLYGLRYENFTQLGPSKIYTYNEDGLPISVKDYKMGEVVSSYNGLSPRFSANYLLNEKNSIKAGYARTYQFLHLLSNATSASPTDIWIPSSNNVKPQICDQWSIGYFRNFNKNMFEFSFETYYKNMTNAVDYRDGAEVTLNPQVEGELLFGTARAYGAEFMLRKQKGDFTGWISYTLAKTEKHFENINDGDWFPAKQDRRHDLAIVTMYKFNDAFTASISWVYWTGSAVTFPSGKYIINGQVVNYYTERNGYRMPPYHRMDVGLTYYTKEYKTITDPETGEEKQVAKKWNSSWNVSVYNAYAHENAYQITFKENEVTGKTEAVQLALFKIIPSLTYNFSF